MADEDRDEMGTTTAGIFAGVAAGDEAALGDLLAHFQHRLRVLAGAKLAQFPKVAPHYETDDVVQQASMRLVRAIRETKPDSPARFWGLVATCIRRELIDLKRKVVGSQGDAKNLYANRPGDPEQHDALLVGRPDTESGPMTNLADEEFHAKADELPEPERSVFRLRYYNRHTHREVGELLGLSVDKAKALWFEAVEQMEKSLKGFWPGQHLQQ
jgi:RNA polymerase sigma-70 factor (ECF subfamily)